VQDHLHSLCYTVWNSSSSEPCLATQWPSWFSAYHQGSHSFCLHPDYRWPSLLLHLLQEHRLLHTRTEPPLAALQTAYSSTAKLSKPLPHTSQFVPMANYYLQTYLVHPPIYWSPASDFKGLVFRRSVETASCDVRLNYIPQIPLEGGLGTRLNTKLNTKWSSMF